MRGAYSFIYVINVVFQSIFTLLMYIGGGLLVSWLLVEKCGLPDWIYILLIIPSIILGLAAMIRFILSAMHALNSLEKNNKNKRRNNEK